MNKFPETTSVKCQPHGSQLRFQQGKQFLYRNDNAFTSSKVVPKDEKH